MLATCGFLFDGAGLGARLGEGAASGLAVSPAGAPAMARDGTLVRQAIMLLLTTVPGERVMRPDYGCPLNRLIFAPNDATTAGLAIHYVRRAIMRWEKRIDIVKLDAGPDLNDPGVLAIRLDYRLRDSGEEASITLGVGLDGGLG
jgi:uncharacterized protein